MMAPDYTHWHGMYEVAERFYMELIPAGPRDYRSRRAARAEAEPATARQRGDRRDPRPGPSTVVRLKGAEEQADADQPRRCRRSATDQTRQER